MPIVSKDEMALRFHQNWREQNPEVDDSGAVDDCLTDLNWLQNLNIMTKFGTPTPETPPASPVPSPESKGLLFSCGAVERVSKGTKVPFCSKPPAVEDVDYKTNGTVKPPYSYATLICMAMKANKNKMTLSAIYKWIKENFMYYRNADPSWQVSVYCIVCCLNCNYKGKIVYDVWYIPNCFVVGVMQVRSIIYLSDLDILAF
ncbi:forkhead box protein J1-B [Trichonephila clavata]|uniref:Forkhead box protein J1-B n=1 Tax=Trichonephila clavata TaxID=2740835 RepID=A0A8X6KW53_TRICU|nr:forkhead box protein J1-B [Trichonephila clavata]